MIAIPRIEGTVVVAVIVWMTSFVLGAVNYIDLEEVLMNIIFSAPGVIVVWVVGTILFLLFGYKRRNPFWIDLLAGFMDGALVIIFGALYSGWIIAWFGAGASSVLWIIPPLFWRILALSLWKVSNKFEKSM